MKSQYQMIADMLALQAQLNDRAFPKWRTDTPDYDLAIISECSELIDAIGWKWWKKQEPRPLLQVQLEVVDIWHFVMSELMVTHCAHPLFSKSDQHSLSAGYDPAIALAHTKALLRNMRDCGVNKISIITDFFNLAGSVRLSIADIYRLYIGKATLNLFRWDHGYAEGSYVKDWLGEEDNDYLEKIIADAGDELDPVKIRAALSLRYEFVLSQLHKV